jgi:acyl-CoA thioester hydrolase
MDTKNTFTWENEVRVNETDLQGIVNNTNYSIYMTQARNKHLKSLGVDFNALHKKGFDLVLVRTEIDFKSPLKNGDEFIVTSKLEPMGRIRFVSFQQVIRKADQKIAAEGKNIATCICAATGRPVIPEELRTIFNPE